MHRVQLSIAMADDEDQDIFDSLEREASEFTKVSPIMEVIWL